MCSLIKTIFTCGFQGFYEVQINCDTRYFVYLYAYVVFIYFLILKYYKWDATAKTQSKTLEGSSILWQQKIVPLAQISSFGHCWLLQNPRFVRGCSPAGPDQVTVARPAWKIDYFSIPTGVPLKQNRLNKLVLFLVLLLPRSVGYKNN